MSISAKILLLWLSLSLAFMLPSCKRAATPRPYGYYRITVPECSYTPTKGRYPFQFEQSTSAQLQNLPNQEGGIWFNLYYPSLNADIHCTYYPIRGNLRELTDDAMEFVYKHVSKATAIPSRDYINDTARVYGALFSIEGNTASPYQFFLTDSTHHFLRGAVYCNARPNVDSLRPVLDFMEQDVMHLIETLKWK